MTLGTSIAVAPKVRRIVRVEVVFTRCIQFDLRLHAHFVLEQPTVDRAEVEEDGEEVDLFLRGRRDGEVKDRGKNVRTEAQSAQQAEIGKIFPAEAFLERVPGGS